MIDNALLLTIVFIIVTTIVGTFLNSRRRDRCLTNFGDFMVTLLEKDGEAVQVYKKYSTNGTRTTKNGSLGISASKDGAYIFYD